MDLTRFLMRRLQGANIDTPIANDKGGSAPAAPAPLDPSIMINADANANRYNVTTPFGSRTWTRNTPDALTYDAWVKQTYPNGAPTSGGQQFDPVSGSYYTTPGGGATDLTSAYNQYTTDFAKNNPGTWEVNESMSPDQRKLYNGRNEIVNALLGRSDQALGDLKVGYDWNGSKDPTTNRYFTQQKKMLDEVFARDEERLDQKLVNQGLPMGGKAYADEFKDFRGAKADAYEKAAADAMDMGFKQDLTTRQQNLNEIAQALGGAQIQPFSWGNQPVDTNSAFNVYEAGRNRQYQGDLAGYNAGIAGNNSMLNGLFSLGTAGITASDRRLKRDIVRVGELTPGIGWYEFRYLWDSAEDPVQHGVMADEVERVMPDAVITDSFGYSMVDYGRVFAGRVVH